MPLALIYRRLRRFVLIRLEQSKYLRVTLLRSLGLCYIFGFCEDGPYLENRLITLIISGYDCAWAARLTLIFSHEQSLSGQSVQLVYVLSLE